VFWVGSPKRKAANVYYREYGGFVDGRRAVMSPPISSMRGGEWYGAFSYHTPGVSQFQSIGMVGVDRNSANRDFMPNRVCCPVRRYRG
jgi:hypothetical protein